MKISLGMRIIIMKNREHSWQIINSRFVFKSKSRSDVHVRMCSTFNAMSCTNKATPLKVISICERVLWKSWLSVSESIFHCVSSIQFLLFAICLLVELNFNGNNDLVVMLCDMKSIRRDFYRWFIMFRLNASCIPWAHGKVHSKMK